MKHTIFSVISLAILLPVFTVLNCGKPAQAPEEIKAIVQSVGNYNHGKSRQSLDAVDKVINDTHGDADLRSIVENELVKILESDASLVAKQFVLQKLWMIGTDASLPVLSGMLSGDDSHLVEAVCYTLSRYSAPEVDEALRNALPESKGTGRIAIINLLGQRREEKNTTPIASLASDSDETVMKAAVAALGKIAGSGSIKKLNELYKSSDPEKREAVASALLQSGRELSGKSKISEAEKIFTPLMEQSNPLHIRRGALEGLIDLGGTGAVDLVFSVLHGNDRDLKPSAIAKVRTLKGEGLSKRLAEELPGLPVGEQALMIEALADRGDAVVRPAIVNAADHSDSQVRITALKALGIIGDASSVEVLINACSGENTDVVNAAKVSLQALESEGVDDAVISGIKSAQGSLRAELITVLSARRFLPSVSFLLDEAENSDTEVSRAALRALRNLAGAESLPRLVDILVNLKIEAVRTDAERAVQQVALGIDDENTQTNTIILALRSEQNTEVRRSLIRTLGNIANRPALDELVKAAGDENMEIQNTAIRSLAEWPGNGAMEHLIKIIEETGNETHKIISLRGYIRLIGHEDASPVEQVENYIRALDYAQRADEIKLVLSGLAEVHHPDALSTAAGYLKNKDVQNEAALAALSIGKAIAATHSDITADAMEKICTSLPNTDLCAQAEEVISDSDRSKPVPDADFFNGKDLTGWDGPLQYWSVIDGVISGKSDTDIPKNEFLWSSVEVKDFYLSVYVKLIPANANSGIQFRSKKADESGQAVGYQADMGQDVWGRLYHEHGRGQLDWTDEGMKYVKHEDWNLYEILAIGNRIWTAINGHLSVAYMEPEGETEGLIAFQVHRGPPQEALFKNPRLIHNPEVKLAGMDERALNLALRRK